MLTKIPARGWIPLLAALAVLGLLGMRLEPALRSHADTATKMCGQGNVPAGIAGSNAVTVGDTDPGCPAHGASTAWKVPPPPKGCPYHLRSYLEGGPFGDKKSKAAILITHKRRARYHGNYVDVRVKARSHKVMCRIDYRENNDAEITVNPGNIKEPYTGFSLLNPKPVVITVFYSNEKQYSNDTPPPYFVAWARDKR